MGIALFIPGFCMAQSDQKTVNSNGWNNLKWSATIKEVKSKYTTVDIDNSNCYIINYPIAEKNSG